MNRRGGELHPRQGRRAPSPAARRTEQADQPGPRSHGLFRNARRLPEPGEQPVQRWPAAGADVARPGNDRPVQDHPGLAGGSGGCSLAVPQGSPLGHRVPVSAG
ncbi:hypothetical protein G6F55_014235 [Rhizopus delemar]|nr:hypothetical protein G6F55_014235 [Rhizopus delemar]